MNLNNLGNIKLVSLLFILGSSSAVLLIPAVIQKENKIIEQNIKGNSSTAIQESRETEEKDGLLVSFYEDIKKDYIDTPIQKITETKNQVSEIIDNPTKALASELEILGENTNILEVQNTNPNPQEPLVRITKEMVENCKIITEEYNKKTN